ncbi:MAG: YicC family protein [Paracoccaceae bacterium]|nr:YicC family protein [Paracoccaceae bacterium]
MVKPDTTENRMTHLPPQVISMTGFAARQGAGLGHEWSWDVRSVNGKGFDLRLRLPEIEGLEAAVRSAVAKVAARGNITLNLRLSRSEQAEGLRLSEAGLAAVLGAVAQIETAARDRGLALAPSRATDLLTLRGVIEQGPPALDDPAALRAALLTDLDALLTDFTAMRAAEGGEIGAVISAQIDRIAGLTEAARAAAEARRPEVAATLRANLARVMEGAPGADPQRIAQELAMLAVKSDVAEEIDRLRAHITAARTLLADPAPVGRKFDFLTQEFVREANTLCSKSGSERLTAIGLDLKHVIDQIREQIQNVE